MISPLSSKDEQRIVTVLEKVAQDPTADANPNAAIVKAAGACDIPAGHINLVVRAYNNARTTWQRESGESSLEKAAEFPIANTAEILRELYPDQPETPNVVEHRAGISDEYSHKPTWYVGPERYEFKAKAAEILARPIKEGKVELYPREVKGQVKRALAICKDQIVNLERYRIDILSMKHKFLNHLEKTAEYIENPNSPAFCDVRDAVETMTGAEGMPILQQLIRLYPHLEKVASRQPYFAISAHKPLVDHLTGAIFAGNAYVEMLSDYEQCSKRAEDEIGKQILPFMDDDDDPNVQPEEDALLDATTSKSANIPLDIVKAVSVSKIRDKVDNMLQMYGDPASVKQKAYAKLNDPYHDAQLRDLETQSMLQDMMINDPVISSHNPHETAAAVNELSRTAPSYAQQPLLTRPFLRQVLEMGTPSDTFQGDTVVGTEHKLREINKPITEAPAEKKDANPGRSKTS